MNIFELFVELKADSSQLSRELNNATNKMQDAEKAAASAERAAKSIGDTSARTARQFERFNSTLSEGYKKLNETVRAFNAGEINARQFARAVDSSARSFSNLENKARDMSARFADAARTKTSFVTRLTSAISVANLASTAFENISSSLKDAGAAVLSFSAKMEQTRIAFGTLMGGAQNATRHLKDLQAFAVSTPFEFESLAKMSQRLQGVGINAEKVIPLLRDIGNVAAATGEISAERVEGITVAISQMISKTKVSAEEMEQLAERGVPAWKILAEATGKTQAEIRKLSEQGAISSDIMVKALQKISSEKFGDAMEKQSKTFSGAMSTIKDAILIGASEAFEPFFQKLSGFTVRLGEELSKQTPQAKTVAEKFGNAIGESIGEGIRNSGGWKNAASNFIQGLIDINQRQGEDLRKVGRSIAQGYTEGLSGLKKITSVADLKKLDYPITSIANLRQADDTIRQISNTTKSLIPLPKLLDAKKAESELKTLNSVVGDLNSKIAFFGQNTEEAATKQRLFNAGIFDLNSGLAKQAVASARTLDALKKAQEVQDKYNDKLTTLRDRLREVRESAIFEVSFPNATELNKFDAWVKTQAENFKELRGEINTTRAALSASSLISAIKDRTIAGRQALTQLESQIDSVGNKNKDVFKGIASDFASSLNLKGVIDNFGIDITPTAFADTIKKYTEAYQTFLDNVGSGQSRETLQKATENLRTYLKSFRVELNGEKLQALSDQQIEAAISKFQRLGAAIKGGEVQSALKTFESLMDSLNDKLDKSAKITERDRIAKQLLGKEYANLTEEQKKLIIAKAEEVDVFEKTAEASKKAAEQQKRFTESTRDFLENVFDKAFSGNWKSMLDDMLGMLRRFAVKAAAELAMSKLFGVQGNSQGNPFGNQGGFSLSSIFGGLFGNGNRTPSFNPNSGGAGAGSMHPIWQQIANDREKIFGAVNQNKGGLSGIFGKGGMFGAKGFGFNSGTGAGIGAMAMMAGGMIGGKWGSLLSSAGMGAQIGSIAGPWGAVIGAGIGAVAGLFTGGFFGGGMKKKLKQAVKNAYGMDANDEALKQLEILAKSMPGQTADAVVRTDIARDILQTYAGNNSSAMDRLDPNRAYDASHASNIYNSVNPSISQAAMASVGSTSGGGSRAMVEANNLLLGRAAQAIEMFVEKFGTASAGDVVMAGAESASRELASAIQKENVNNPWNVDAQLRNTGFAY